MKHCALALTIAFSFLTNSGQAFGYFYVKNIWNKLSCFSVVQKIATNETVPMQAMGLVETITRLTRKSKEFPKWSMQEGNLRIKPIDLLPESLVRDLEKQIGPITVKLTPRELSPPFAMKGFPGDVRGFNLALGSKYNEVLQISFGSSPSDPKIMYVDELLANDPRIDARPGREYQHQGKGLPALAMFEALHSLEDIARASGATEIRTSGASTYIGYQLYSRVNKMAPLNQEARDFYEDVDRKYRLARKILPANFAPFTVGSMTENLGNYIQENEPPFTHDELRRAVLTGQAPRGYAFGKDAQGTPQFLYKPESPEDGVFFLIESEPGSVIDWTRAHHSGLLWLSKKL